MRYENNVKIQEAIAEALKDRARSFNGSMDYIKINEEKQHIFITQSYQKKGCNRYFVKNRIDYYNFELEDYDPLYIGVTLSKDTNWCYDKINKCYYHDHIEKGCSVIDRYFHFTHYWNYCDDYDILKDDLLMIGLINDGERLKIRIYSKNPILPDDCDYKIAFSIYIFEVCPLEA